MQINSTMAYEQFQGTDDYGKNSHFVLVNQGKTFQIFSRTYRQNSRTFLEFERITLR